MNREYKEQLARQIEKNFSNLEMRIMQDIVRRIKKAGKITSTADYQINRLIILGNSSEDIEKMLKETLEASYPEMFELYDKVIDWEYVRNKDIYEQINAEYIPYEENEELQQITNSLIQQTDEELKNITQSLGFYLDYGNGKRILTPLGEVYQSYLDAACMDIATGAFDYNTVIRRVVTQLTNSGLRQIDYASGWANRVDVASRRAVMTGITQLTGRISDYNADKLHTEYFEVAWHAGARPTHAMWQGKVWSKEELVTVCGLGTGPGLEGWNCYHERYPFIPGISERNWTDEWLEEQNRKENTPKEFKGKKYTLYEAKQRQRQMETAMRAQRQKAKLLQDGDADPDDIMLAKAKYQGQLNEYTRFSKKMGLKEERERIYYDMRGRVAPSKKAYEKYKQSLLQKETLKQNKEMKRIRYSRFSERFEEYNNGQKDVITTRRLLNNLNKSNIGKETVEYIMEHPELKIQMCYNIDHEYGILGNQFGDEIKIYASESKTVQRTAEILIHEVTHHRYNIGESQWAECVCKAQELRHRSNKDKLTGDELRSIIKSVKELYPEYTWR